MKERIQHLVGRAVDYIYEKHQRHGMLRREIERLVNQDRNYFTAAMLALGEADAMITGTTRPFSQSLRQVRMIIEDEPEAVYAQIVAEGLHPGLTVRVIKNTPQRVVFWADGDEHLLAPLLAANISVLPLAEDQPLPEEVCGGVPLNTLKPGQSGQVVTLSPRLRGPERRRMMDLGILPGTTIKAEFISAGGDPVAYNIRGALIALRKEQAELICINPLAGVQPAEAKPALMETAS